MGNRCVSMCSKNNNLSQRAIMPAHCGCTLHVRRVLRAAVPGRGLHAARCKTPILRIKTRRLLLAIPSLERVSQLCIRQENIEAETTSLVSWPRRTAKPMRRVRLRPRVLVRGTPLNLGNVSGNVSRCPSVWPSFQRHFAHPSLAGTQPKAGAKAIPRRLRRTLRYANGATFNKTPVGVSLEEAESSAELTPPRVAQFVA